MTPTQQQLIRSSWSGAPTEYAAQAAQIFYGRLFELDPSAQDLFRHTDMKKQRKLLVQTLAVVVANIGRLEEVIPARPRARADAMPATAWRSSTTPRWAPR